VRFGYARAFATFPGYDGLDFYATLGVAARASPLEIKTAFRRLAKTLHPDCNPGNQMAVRRFNDVHLAYTLLSNAEWRAAYDRELERIRVGAEVQAAAARSRHKSRRRIFWREAAKTTAATIVLTVCFIVGLSIWQQTTNGLQRQTVAAPTTVTSTPGATPVSANGLAPHSAAVLGATLQSTSGPASSADESAHDPAPSPAPATFIPPAVSEGEVADALFGRDTADGNSQAPSGDAAVQSAAGPAVDEPAPGPAATDEPAPQPAASTDLANVENPAPSRRNEATDARPSNHDRAIREQGERFISLGERHLAEGNIAIARQYFARAVDLGLATAANRLAETFEPDGLARHGVHGVKPDPNEAGRWRQRALELGR